MKTSDFEIIFPESWGRIRKFIWIHDRRDLLSEYLLFEFSLVIGAMFFSFIRDEGKAIEP